MKKVLDAHCHTVSSGHAYSTVRENAQIASEKGLELLAITDHAPSMIGAPSQIHFVNYQIIPKYLFGVEILSGVELNILDSSGKIDLPENILKYLDVVIASLHTICIEPLSADLNTQAVINAIKNPYVKIIGHLGDPRFPVHINEIVDAAKEYSVAIEINNASLNPKCLREGNEQLIKDIAKTCLDKNCHIIMGSDAHIADDVGNFDFIEHIVTELNFPENLVLNSSVDRFKEFIKR